MPTPKKPEKRTQASPTRSEGHWETTDTGTLFPRIWVEDNPTKPKKAKKR